MRNRNLSVVLQIIGWITILDNAWLLVSSVVTTTESTETILDIFVLLFVTLLSYPYLYLGIFLVWLGQLVTKNNTSVDDNEKNKTADKGTKFIGLIIVIAASIYTFLGFNITNDAEGKAYRVLLVTPGVIGIVVGLIIIWLGMRIQKKKNG